MDNNTQAFFELVKAGLWEKDVQLSQFDAIDFNEVYRLAEEQSVVGLVAAGIEHVIDVKAPQDVALTFVGQALQLEQRNMAMNQFISRLIVKLRNASIYTLLLKGQEVAQCYERPLWRACGDIDLLLDEVNYQKAKQLLSSVATSVEKEDAKRKHLGLIVDSWLVELHGSLRTYQLPNRTETIVESVQRESLCHGEVRVWRNGTTDVFLPSVNNDIIITFSHILQHYFGGGIGLRQICDLCRLLWANQETIDITLLKSRLKAMGMMTEWKVFASLAVHYLGMPIDAVPLYSSSKQWGNKAKRMLSFILYTGNMGQNRDGSYRKKYPLIVWKSISLWHYICDTFKHFFVFPLDSLRVLFNTTSNGILSILKL